MILTIGTVIEINTYLSQYKIFTAVAAAAAQRHARRNYIPVTHPLISDRRIRGARKMIPS